MGVSPGLRTDRLVKPADAGTTNTNTVKPAKGVTTNMACPTQNEIANCLAGQLPRWQIESIFQHAENCLRCQINIDLIENSADHSALFVGRHLEWIRDETNRQIDSECERMMRRAAQLVDTSRPATADSECDGSTPRVPQRIRDYELRQIVGEGGMGTVYHAWHIRLKRHVALKVLSTSRSHSERAVHHFVREMEAVGRLNHPHIIRALDAGIDDGIHYLAMELVDGLDVGEIVRSLGELSLADAAAITVEIADALDYAHSRGLVHRDVKPSNIMLSAAGEALLMDLGLALLTDPHGRRQGRSDVLGSLHYLAPEQATDSGKVDARADVYGLGCTLYHIMMGQPPFAAEPEFTAAELLGFHAKCEPPKLSARRPDVPEEFGALVQRMLHKSPKHRPSMQQVSRQLAPFAVAADLAAVVRRARQNPTDGGPAYSFSRQIVHQPPATGWARSRLAVLVSLLCLSVGIRLATWAWQRQPPPSPTTVVQQATFPIAKDAMKELAEQLKSETSGPRSRLASNTIVAEDVSEGKTYRIQDRPGARLRIEISSPTEDGTSNVTYQVWDNLELKLKYPELYDKLAWIWSRRADPAARLQKDGWKITSRVTVRSIDGGKFRFLDAWTPKANLHAARNHRGNLAVQHGTESQHQFGTIFAKSVDELRQQFPEAAESLGVLESTLIK